MSDRSIQVKAALKELTSEARSLLDCLQNMTEDQFAEKRAELVSDLGTYLFKINRESNIHNEICDAAVKLPTELLRCRDLHQWIAQIEAAISELEFWNHHYA